MSARTVDLSVELLSGGLGKLAGKCIINGRLQANPEGVALVVQVVTSLFASPPSVATHIVDTEGAAELPDSGIPGGSKYPLVAAPAATRRGARTRRRAARVSRRDRRATGAQARARSQRGRRKTFSWQKWSSWGRTMVPHRPRLGLR